MTVHASLAATPGSVLAEAPVTTKSRGRPPGSTVPLLADPGRFEVAIWLLLTRFYGLRPYPAATLVTMLSSDRPITASTIDGVLIKLSTTRHTTIRGHADRVRRKAEAAAVALTEAERDWISESGGSLHLLIDSLRDAPGAFAVATADLDALGWSTVLARFRKRLGTAMQSNLPPCEDRVRPAVQRLADRLLVGTRATP